MIAPRRRCDRIKELRQARKLTQEELARRRDVGADAVREWERGKRTPTIDMAATLADALECRPMN